MAIVLCTIISFLLAISILTSDRPDPGFGGIFNLIIPPVYGIIAILFFLLVSWISKDNVVRIFTTVIVCIGLLYTGLAFRNEWAVIGL